VNTTVDELAALVGGEVTGKGGATRITGVAGIADATAGHITFFANRKYLADLKECKASAVLVPADFAADIPPVLIKVANPSVAFAQILKKFASPPITQSPGVHPSAILGRDVSLGEDVCIQPYVVIEDGAKIGRGSCIGAHGYIGHGAKIGDGCKIYPHVTIREGSIMGNRVIVHSGAVIGGDGFGFELVNGRHVKIPQTGIVQIDDDVEIGANTTIDRARFGRTWIQEGAKIDNLVQIAHNVIVGKHSILVAQVGISGSSKLGSFVTLAGQVGVVGHIEIGDQAVVGAKSGVSKSVPAKEAWLGIPACRMDEQKAKIASLNRLPKLQERLKKLEQILDSDGKSFPKNS
jgi:UDP-3-O-[3-hydroxymyristoyl] glucosamine N-acyltransferase